MSEVTLPQFVLLPGGEFAMGNDSGRADEQPVRRVTVSPFLASTTPVTNQMYSEFIAATGHGLPRFWGQERFDRPGQPVVGVSWDDAQAYCRWLCDETGRQIRLPTEAEREFAARGGLKGHDWPWGPQPPKFRLGMEDLAGLSEPHEPRAACANAFGLMCMADNVHEWCSDWYQPTYTGLASSDPAGPSAGKRRASRGGSWRHAVKFTPVAARSSLDPSFRYNDYGFRVYANA